MTLSSIYDNWHPLVDYTWLHWFYTVCVTHRHPSTRGSTPEKYQFEISWFQIVLCICLSIVRGGQDLSSFRAGTSFPVGAQPHAQFCPDRHPVCQPQDAPVPGCGARGSGHRGYRLPFLCQGHYPPLWPGHQGEPTVEQGTFALLRFGIWLSVSFSSLFFH